VWPLDELAAVAAAARESGLAVHLDGARILNAAVASGLPASEFGRLADSVTLCFSKGLGCPLGAVLASSAERIEEAWHGKFLFGGAMRQAGIVAAAALYALDHHVERLAEDHARARRLADGLAAAGLPVEPEEVDTNFVGIALEPLGLDAVEAKARVREAGVLVSDLRPGVLRAATYLGITDEDVAQAVEAVPRALGALARA
jgi:threonine aldolase